MGANQTKLENVNTAKVIEENRKEEEPKSSQQTTNPHGNFQHPKIPTNIDLADIPSECPMHQAKRKAEAEKTGGCPVDHSKSDINPQNMVRIFYF